jgi:hypothetical protein
MGGDVATGGADAYLSTAKHRLAALAIHHHLASPQAPRRSGHHSCQWLPPP